VINPVCPHCNLSLKPRRSSQLGRYYCPSCFGLVANIGDLVRFLSDVELGEFRQRVKTSPEGAAPCTHCRKKMNVVWHLVGQNEVELDACVRCDVVWFDTGEAQGLAGRTATLEHARARVAIDNQIQSAKSGGWTDAAHDLPLGKTLLTFINLPVEEEKDFFHSRPWVTWSLIAACTVVTIFGFYNRDFMLANFAYFQSAPLGDRLVHGVTSFFIHADIFHLLGNMYFLWIFGDNVEDEIGKPRYLSLLAAATVVGGLLFGAFDPTSRNFPLIGASGGIAGLVAFYLLRFPHRRFLTRFFFFLLVPIPGFVFGAMFFLKDLIGAYAEMAGGTKVAHLAHLGGAMIGLGAAFWIPKKVRAK
jgi:membrane associated rhomboid family serine protease/Zn-finger nucleic acid-binding protein